MWDGVITSWRAKSPLADGQLNTVDSTTDDRSQTNSGKLTSLMNCFPTFASSADFPLCRRYLGFQLLKAPVEIRTDETIAPAEIRLISGTTRDAESELLSVGIAISPSQSWTCELDELQQRGVERVQYAVTSDLIRIQDELQARFSEALTLPSFAELINHSDEQVAALHRPAVRFALQHLLTCETASQARAMLAGFQSSRCGARYPWLVASWRAVLDQAWALWSLPSDVRRQVLAADAEAAGLNRRIGQSIARHGPFEDANATLAFVTAALVRAQRRVGTTPAVALTEHHRRYKGVQPQLTAPGI